MKKIYKSFLIIVVFAFLSFSLASSVNALLMGVSGPNSSEGTAPAIIAPPQHALDDIVTNTEMQGFNEAQGVFTTAAHAIDGGGTIPVGTQVDSHMIFLNSVGSNSLTHRNVDWVFSGVIIGIMSDVNGNLEAASTFELGAPGTNYTVTFSGSGPAAPYSNRGMEGGDSYSLLNETTLRVTMTVSEPGDWIRVITEASPVPEPSACLLFLLGIAGIVGIKKRLN